jgi:hypothetical protein
VELGANTEAVAGVRGLEIGPDGCREQIDRVGEREAEDRARFFFRDSLRSETEGKRGGAA